MAAIFILICASAAWAERRVALVFGTDRYETIRPLSNAVNDALAIQTALEALDFEIHLETNRDLRRMTRALDDFEEDAKGADVAVLFFAGHGVEVDGENRLLPSDVDASSREALEQTSLALNDVHAVITRVAQTALIVLDACRNDPFGTVSDPQGRGAFSLSLPDTVRPGLGRVGAAENTLFAFSAAPGETALDGTGENSPFTAALSRYLGTDGLEIRSVLTLVQQEVYDRTRGRQLPYVESGLPSLFFASQKATRLPERERLLLAMAEIDETARADVERVARELGAPLAPLYGALIGSDLARLDRQQRRVKLTEAATAFVRVRDQLRLLHSEDEEVTALRRRAEEQLLLGAFDAAREHLTQAARIDATSRDTLKANLAQRTLSEAATHVLNGGAALAELQYQLAISDHTKAVALFDEVEEDLFPAGARRQRLNALGVLGHIHITTGNLSEAAIAFERQLVAAEVAVATDPTDTDFVYALALAHDNLGDVRFEQGKIAEAFVHYRAGHEARRALSEANPDDDNIKFALSNSYHRLGQIYHRQGDLAAAEALYLEKHRLGAAVVATAPAGYRWQRDLSLSDERLGDILRDRGDLPRALDRYVSSLSRMEPIRDANPEDLELRRFTSITLDRIGEVYADQGDLTRAKQKFEESRAVRETLVQADPANVDWQYVLGISHERLGDLLSRMGEMEEATKAYTEKHRISALLAASDPTNVRWLRDLSVADERLGKLARGRGDLDAAKAYFQSSLTRMQAVRNTSATDMELIRFVSFTQDLLAHVHLDEGNSAAALNLYERSRDMRQKLVEHDPENADWRFILGVSYELIGNTYMRIGQPEQAAVAYQQELETMSVLLERAPDSLRWARAVSITNELLGNALFEAGDVQAAIAHYTTSLTRMSALRDADPANLSLQRFTAVTLRHIGRAKLEIGDQDAALRSFQDSADISRRLVDSNPQNAQWLRDLLRAQKGVIDAQGGGA